MQKEMLEIKSSVPVVKNDFDGQISRLTTVEPRISQLWLMPIETSQTEIKREKKIIIKEEISKNHGTLTKGVAYRRRKRERGAE